MRNTDRKSMDDVLASIRRIVRADKEGAMASTSGNGPNDESRRRPDAEEPLLLTPEMRAEAAGSGTGEVVRGAAAGPGAAMPDRDALRAIVRELLLEELSGGAAEDAVRRIIRDELTSGQIGNNISQNVLRTIRAEVTKALHESR